MSSFDDVARLIDAARSGRISRPEIFARGEELKLTTAATLMISRAARPAASFARTEEREPLRPTNLFSFDRCR